MRKTLLCIVLLIISLNVSATVFYMSSTGSDSNNGSIGSPWRTFAKVNATLQPGDILYVRGGTYLSLAGNAADHHFFINGLHGTSTDSISIRAYPGEVPTFSCENITPSVSDPYLMFMNDCSYVHIKGFHIYYLKQYAVMGAGISRGFSLSSSNNCTVDRFEIECIGGQGLIIENQSANNFIVDTDSHHNSDYYNSYDAADGFSATGPTTNNINNHWVRCRSFMNSDDGFDTFNTITVNYYDNCLSYYNGFNPFGAGGTQVDPANKTPLDTSVFFSNPAYWVGSGEGFKLGKASSQLFNTITKYLTNCLAFMNRGTGYAANSINQMSTRMSLINCVAYCNSNDGFSFGAGWQIGFSQIFVNDWSWKNNQSISGADYVYDGNNSLGGISNDVWMTTQGNVFGQLHPPLNVSNADFLSVDQTTLTAARQSDGSYPTSNFLKLAPTSDLLDAGIPAGLPYCGSAPDINWAEYCVSTFPTVNIGANQNITLPINSVSFTPTVTNATSVVWNTYSGTAGTFAPNTTTQNVSYGNLNTAGVRGVRLCVTNSSGTICDSALVTVSNATPVAPTCSSLSSATITLPTSSIALTTPNAVPSGGATITGYNWVRTSGPLTYTITNANLQNTTVTGLVQGTYVFTVTATDNNGLTCSAPKTVIVNAAVPQPPVVTVAPANTIITLPTNSVNLTSTSTTPQGTITVRQWTASLATGSYTITTPTTNNTSVTGLTQGIYHFKFCATNSDGLTTCDSVSVTVNAAIVPTAVCAPNITLTLPVNNCTLSGLGTGAIPLSYLWTKLTGPITYTLVTPNATSTQFNGLVAGTYTIEYKVTDANGSIARDTMSALVNTANVPPTVDALPVTQTITLPVNSVSVTSTSVASTGSITAILWSKVTGPATYTITTPTLSNTTITGLVQGTYTFKVLVTQTGGLQAADTITVIVNPAGSQSGNGIKYFQTSIYNNRDVYLGFTFYPADNPTTKYLICQIKTAGVFVDFGGRIIPAPNIIDYWGYFDLVGKPKGNYEFRIMQKDEMFTYYSPVKTVKKK